MASTAHSFGDGVWGIAAEETGFIIESVTHEFTQDQKSVKNRTGNDTGVTYYNEKVKVSLKGKIPATSAFSGTLAATLTLGNALDDYLKGGVSGGLTLVDGITVDFANEDYKGISLNATVWPSITA